MARALRPCQKRLQSPTRTCMAFARAYHTPARCLRLTSCTPRTPISTPTKQHLLTSALFKRHDSTAAQPQRSFADPSRPDLFYHLLDPPTPLPNPSLPAYALSFLEELPDASHSPAIIGWLPAVAGAEGEAGLNDFRENPQFRDLMHRAIREGLEQDVDEVQRNGALQLQAGWMHIHGTCDLWNPHERNIPALGRIGDPDDIIASVLVEDGKILPDTYQPMPAYRIVTADGVVQLSEGLARKLLELSKRA
ncbi:hypothetical protein HDZ31DRAFT_35159 [Schizophyllum fasciatum]